MALRPGVDGPRPDRAGRGRRGERPAAGAQGYAARARRRRLQRRREADARQTVCGRAAEVRGGAAAPQHARRGAQQPRVQLAHAGRAQLRSGAEALQPRPRAQAHPRAGLHVSRRAIHADGRSRSRPGRLREAACARRQGSGRQARSGHRWQQRARRVRGAGTAVRVSLRPLNHPQSTQQEGAMLTEQAIQSFRASLRGKLVQPGDADYDAVRALYNGMIDKRPRLIARCVDVADVISAVNFGREQSLLVAIRGGGHNGPGLGSCNDGLVIDLSMMKGVRVDPASRTGRGDAGCTSGDVDHATHPFGLAVPFGIVSTTGVAGLTPGGGTGYLTRKYGLTIDNLLEADVVLADGKFVTASKSQHPDLLWALRGGGGNFGVVTSFLFQAHPVSTVYAGPIFWEAKHAKAVMRAYRDFLPTAPEELGAFVGDRKS